MELNDKSVVFGPLLQRSVEIWCKSCFGEDTYFNKEERIHRFIEEALELAQSLGCTKEEIGMLTDYVFSRPKGEPNQEVGGVMITCCIVHRK